MPPSLCGRQRTALGNLFLPPFMCGLRSSALPAGLITMVAYAYHRPPMCLHCAEFDLCLISLSSHATLRQGIWLHPTPPQRLR